MGCYPVSVVLNGLLPLQRPDQGVFTSSVLWLLGITPSVGLNMGFTPSVGLKIGLNMGFTPSVGLNIGFTPLVVYLFGLYPICVLVEGLYPHPWFVWRAFSPSVIWLKGFTLTVFWFISRDVTPNKEYWVFVLRCRATSFLDLPNLVSTVLPLYYPMSFIHVHAFMHIQHAYKYHSCMVALSVLF